MGSKGVKKGILKPLKYFSTMFDNNKEASLQIGFPTDVKHVAHIGWDGPNLTAPTWMNEYHSAPLAATGNPWGSQDSIEENVARPAPLSPNTGSSAADNPTDSTDQPTAAPVTTRPRHSRRPQSDGNLNTDSASHDPTADGSAKRGRRKPKKEGATSSSTTDAQGQDAPGLPKHTHRRRPKGSSTGSGELVKSSRPKASTAAKKAQDEQNDDDNRTDTAAVSLNEIKENEEDEL